MAKRTKLKIIYDILKIIYERNNKILHTHILYASNLSHQMLRLYLEELMGKEFIKVSRQKNRKIYQVTDKGIEYIARYDNIIIFQDVFGLSTKEAA